MEVFGFLKFRRSFSSSGSSTTTTITSSASDSQALEAEDDNSFFDLVFAPPNSDIRNRRNDNDNDNDDDNCKRKISPVEDASKNFSLLRSPQKFKVLILGFKKSKLEKTEIINNSEGKEFPISSLFSRDRSLRSQLNNERYEESSSSSTSSYKSKQFSKQVVNLIKPLYVRVSSKYNSKKKFREACRSLVKSRSTSSSSSSAGIVPVLVNRRDDSEKQQQDGIQSAILYCKRSYSSNSSSSSCSYLQRVISEDEKRISI